jgi:hypothetical protein
MASLPADLRHGDEDSIMSDYVSVYDLCEKLPRRRVIELGSSTRASFQVVGKPGFTRGCCDSCHEDHAEGYAPRDESWIDDKRYYVKKGPNAGSVPWGLQFCCCAQSSDFEDRVKDEIALRATEKIT